MSHKLLTEVKLFKSFLGAIVFFISITTFATPNFMVISGAQAEAMFNTRLSSVICNGITCSWTDPDQITSPNSIVQTCSAKTYGLNGGNPIAVPNTAICFVSRLD